MHVLCTRCLHRVTLAFAATKGSRADLSKLFRFCADGKVDRDIVLPVLYAALNPARIPELLQDLDSASDTFSIDDAPIVGALTALNMVSMGVAEKVYPPEVFCLLWTRMWPWIQLSDTHLEALPGMDTLFPPSQQYSDHLSVLWHLRADLKTREVIYATPGVRVVLARAWMTLLENPDCANEIGFRYACLLLDPLHLFESQYLTDLLDGVGGTVTDLARVAVRHIQCVIGASPRMSEKEALMLQPVFSLLEFRAEEFLKVDDDKTDPLGAALVSHGISGALTEVLCAVSVASGDYVDGLLVDTFKHLHYALFTPPYRALVDSLASGLLRAIVDCATSRTYFGVENMLRTTIEDILSTYMVYSSVLPHMERALVGVEELANSPEFRASAVFSNWEKFVTRTIRHVITMSAIHLDRGMSFDAVHRARQHITAHLGAKPSIGRSMAIVQAAGILQPANVAIPSISQPAIYPIYRLPCTKCSFSKLSSCRKTRTCLTACQWTTRLVTWAWRWSPSTK
ncbi:hypothetical protein DFH06DRAFT_1223591 [Mycena polygramma]|nr:hypothetical protein DFH06DRAFT_1223591 [Mycena polygramma]